MKRIAVFSDTHGTLFRLPEALAAAGEVDAFLHLGDYGSDAVRIAESLPVPYYMVRGNCDYDVSLPKYRIVEFESAAIAIVHGDAYRSTHELARFAEEHHCQAVLFGHTHTPLVAAQGPILIVNPGSLSLPRMGSTTSFAILSVEGRDVNVKIIPL